MSKYDGQPLTNEKPFRSIMGAFEYCILIRLDIACSLNKLCQFLQCPSDIQWQAIKRLLRYLKGTERYGIML